MENADINENAIGRRKFLGLGYLTAGAALMLPWAKTVEAQCRTPQSTPNYLSLKDYPAGAYNSYFQAYDYTSALSEAISCLGANGGTIFVPKGSYYLSAPIRVSVATANTITLLGEGNSSEFILAGAQIRVYNTYGMRISNLKFTSEPGDSNAILALPEDQILVCGGQVVVGPVVGPKNLTVDNCEFVNCNISLECNDSDGIFIHKNRLSGKNSGIWIDGGTHVVITENMVSNKEVLNQGGISISCQKSATPPKYVLIRGNEVFECAESGIWVPNGEDVVIDNNLCYKNGLPENSIPNNAQSYNGGSGIGINNRQTDSSKSSYQKPKRVVVSNNICNENANDGIDINIAPVDNMFLNVVGNIASGNRGGAGIYAENCQGIILSSNILEENSGSGINMKTCYFASFNSNYLFKNSQSGDSHKDFISGISITDSDDCILVGNIATNAGQVDGKQQYGFSFLSGVSGGPKRLIYQGLNSLWGNIMGEVYSGPAT